MNSNDWLEEVSRGRVEVARLRRDNEAHIYRPREEIMQQENEMYRLRQQRDALLEALEAMIDLAEFWINHRQERHMSEERYKLWLALGHKSNAILNARAAIHAVKEQP